MLARISSSTLHFLLWFGLLALGATPADSAPCGVPIPGIDDWEIASPAQSGVDAETLCVIDQRLAAPDRRNMHAVLVVRHGKLIYEAYAPGRDREWGTDLGIVAHGPATRHETRSVSKSITSLLVGIAIDRKHLAGSDQPVLALFPEYADLKTPDKDAILLRHLLTMTPGLDWDEETAWRSDTNDYWHMYEAADPYRYVLGRDVVAAPGKRWVYNGGATELLGAAIEKSTGQPLDAFSKQALFEPLGIRSAKWLVLPKNGDAIAGSGLLLSARDMAKIGQLVLNGGTWKGQRIVSEAWLRESTERNRDYANSLRYRYQWWAGTSRALDQFVEWVAAMGQGGQRIFILPALDMVVVTTAGLYDDDDYDQLMLTVLEQEILPALRNPPPP